MALKKVIGELHRRSIWQVMAGYLVFVWLLFETFDVIRVTVGLPDWVEPTAAVLLIVLLPALLATASIQKGKPAAWPRITTGTSDAEEQVSSASSSETAPPTQPGTALAPGEAAPKPRTPLTAIGLLTWRNTLVGGGAPSRCWPSPRPST